MRSIPFIFVLILCQTFLSAQTRRMASPEQGRTFTTQNQNRTILPILQMADRQIRVLDYENAFLTLENAVAQNPNAAEAFLLRAKVKHIIGMSTDAAVDVQEAYRLNPYAADLYGYNGNSGLLRVLSFEPEQILQELSTYQKMHYYFKALDQRMMQQKVANDEASWLTQILEKLEAGDLEEARQLLDKEMDKYPKSAMAHDLNGLVLGLESDNAAAVKALNKAVDLDPGYAMAWYNQGRIEHKLGNLNRAKKSLDRAIEIDDQLDKARFERARVLKALGDRESALADYNAIIKNQGENYAEAYLNRGLTQKMLGLYGDALTDLTQVIRANPDNAELWKNRGNLHLLLGLNNKAIDDYNQALKLNRSYAEAYYNRAIVHLLFYDKISACADLQESIDLGFERAVEMKQYFCTE
ncbi:MAG: tetratricopeptide repeat protein [Bacteroidota bacterium]